MDNFLYTYLLSEMGKAAPFFDGIHENHAHLRISELLIFGPGALHGQMGGNLMSYMCGLFYMQGGSFEELEEMDRVHRNQSPTALLDLRREDYARLYLEVLRNPENDASKVLRFILGARMFSLEEAVEEMPELAKLLRHDALPDRMELELLISGTGQNSLAQFLGTRTQVDLIHDALWQKIKDRVDELEPNMGMRSWLYCRTARLPEYISRQIMLCSEIVEEAKPQEICEVLQKVILLRGKKAPEEGPQDAKHYRQLCELAGLRASARDIIIRHLLGDEFLQTHAHKRGRTTQEVFDHYEEYSSFGAWVKALRRSYKLDQSSCMKALGIDERTIHTYENSIPAILRSDEIRKVANLYFNGDPLQILARLKEDSRSQLEQRVDYFTRLHEERRDYSLLRMRKDHGHQYREPPTTQHGG